MPWVGNRFLHSPVALCTRRYCFLVCLVLVELMSYAYAWKAGSCTYQWTCVSWILFHELFEIISYAYTFGTGPYTYRWPIVPGDIVSWFIRSWERLLAMPYLGDRFLHSPVALHTRENRIMDYSVLAQALRSLLVRGC